MPKSPHAQLFLQVKVADGFDRVRPECGRRVGADQTEATATRRAVHVTHRSFIDQLNRVSTVRTSDVHGNTFEGRV